MDSDTESTFEMVGGKTRERIVATAVTEDEAKAGKKMISQEELAKIEEKKKKKLEKKMSKKQIVFQELAAFAMFSSTLIFICFFDLFDLKVVDILLGRPPKTDDNFKMNVAEFIAEMKQTGRLNRPVNTADNAALFYMLSEKQPIEVAFRRQWIPDLTRFEGVELFVRGMGWENTFDEDIFVRGVPDFDPGFELAEMTLKTTMNGKGYNRKFLNLGQKEMIDKTHSIEYFTSQRSLIRMEKKDGKELARTEYFLKHGDLYVFDKRGNLECTRVYYAPFLDKSMKRRLQRK